MAITGKKFGRLTAIRHETTNKKGRHYWKFECNCGGTLTTSKYSVTAGDTKSCGCYQKECAKRMADTLLGKYRTTHGLSKHPIHTLWSAMRCRVNNKNQEGYKNYGGRGISICTRWNRFENFYEDMIPTWRKGLSLDRIDNNGDYSKKKLSLVNKKRAKQQ
jgi:hypothetical protein